MQSDLRTVCSCSAALALRELTCAEMRSASTARSLAPRPAATVYAAPKPPVSSSSSTPAPTSAQVVQAAQWTWPKTHGLSPLLRLDEVGGSDAVSFAAEHAGDDAAGGAQWMQAFADVLGGDAVRVDGDDAIDVRKLGLVVSHSTRLRGIQLRGCGLGDAGASAIAQALGARAAAPALECLHLSDNGIGPRGAAELAASLPPSVKRLGLEYNAIGDEGAGLLAELLGRNSTLVALDVAANGIGDAGVLLLLDALASNGDVEQLNLRGNPCRSPKHAAPALDPFSALLGGDAAPVKSRVLFD